MLQLHYSMAKDTSKIRVSFYIEKDLYLPFRSQLVVKNKTVAKWLRERIKRFMETHDE